MKRKLHTRRKQRGAVAVLAAIAMIAGLTAAMLAVEIGRLYSANRQLNSFASMAAMDSSRIVGGCDRSSAPTFSDVQAEIGQSLTRNGAYDLFDDTRMEVALGYVTTVDGRRTLVPTPADQATAVSVTLREDFPQPFLPLLPSSEGREMVATAIATQEVVGLISVGTSLLTIDTSKAAALNRLLTPVLGGGSVNLSVAGYQGLADARVTLQDLMIAAGAATPGDFLDLHTDLPGALQIIGDALSATGEGTQVAAAGTLDSLVALIAPNRNNIRFSDILKVEEGLENVAAKLPINTLELMMALAQDAAVGYPLQIPVGVTIPGLANVTIDARIGSPPTMAMGRPGYLEDGNARTQAHTSQIQLDISGTITDLSAIRTIPGLGLLLGLLPVTADLDFDATVEIGWATATFTEVRCAWSSRPVHEVTVEVESGLASVELSGGQLLNVANVLTINLPGGVSTAPAEAAESLDFLGPFVPKLSQLVPGDHVALAGQGVDSALSGVVGQLTSQLTSQLVFGGLVGNVINGLGLNALLARVGTLFTPLFTLLDHVLADTLTALGIELGTATVTVEAVDIHPPLVFEKN